MWNFSSRNKLILNLFYTRIDPNPIAPWDFRKMKKN